MAASPNDYITATDIKNGMPDTTWGASYDTFFGTLATAASRAVDLFLGVEPGAYKVTADEIRYFTGSGTTRQWIDPFVAAPTEVAMDLVGDRATYTVVTSTDYSFWPTNAAQLGQPYRRLDMKILSSPTYYIWYPYTDGIKVTAKFGQTAAVPADITRACLTQATRWFKRAQQGYDDTGAIVALGQLRYLQKLDPDIEAILAVHPGAIAI